MVSVHHKCNQNASIPLICVQHHQPSKQTSLTRPLASLCGDNTHYSIIATSSMCTEANQLCDHLRTYNQVGLG